MASLIASIVSKTTATIEKVSSLASLAGYRSRTIASEILQTTKLKAEYLTGAFVSQFVRTETVNIAEILTRLFGKNPQDQVNLTDSINNINFGKNPGDSVNLSDTFNRTVVFSREQIDQVNIGESDVIDFNKNSSDQFNISDSVYVERGLFTNFSDQVNTTDDINGAAVDDDQTVSFFKTSSEQINFGDQLNLTMLFTRTPTDQTNISNPGLIVNQDYINGPDYFLEDYVGVSRTIT
jgi:hypothetical protein